MNWSVVNMKFALCVFCLLCCQVSCAHLKDSVYAKLSVYDRAFSGVLHWHEFSVVCVRTASPWLLHTWFSQHITICGISQLWCWVILLLYFFLLIYFTKFSECLPCSKHFLGIRRKNKKPRKTVFLFYICTGKTYQFLTK